MNDRQSESDDGNGAVRTVRVRSLVGLAIWAAVLFLAFRFFAATTFVVLCWLAAASLAAAIRPLADRLPGPTPVRSVAATAVVLLGVWGLLAITGLAMVQPVKHNIERLPQIRQRANEGFDALADRFGIEQDLTVDQVGDIAIRFLTGGSLGQWISNVASTLLTVLLAVVVVIIAAMYLLSHKPGRLTDAALVLLPPERHDMMHKAMADLQPQLRWWLIGMLINMLTIGLTFGAGYWLIGLEFALPLALFAAVAAAVPTFGPMITLLLSVLIAAPQGWPIVAGVFVVYMVVQALESYLITPLVMHRAVRIPPIVTLFSIIFWGNVFGAAGLVLAIPLDLAIWALLKPFLMEQQTRG
ncbi:MAG: AI-2E family transporter [Planctomycetota bacterium]